MYEQIDNRRIPQDESVHSVHNRNSALPALQTPLVYPLLHNRSPHRVPSDPHPDILKIVPMAGPGTGIDAYAET